MNRKIVWRFTNGKELNEKEFCEYFERKIFKTIRKYQMIKEFYNKEIPIIEGEELNKKVLNYVLSKKFKTKISKKSIFSYKSLTEIAEKIFENILKGKFKKMPTDLSKAPLQLLKDEEIELYALLKNIEGKKRKKNERIQKLFQKFKEKNPDLENNILKAFLQVKEND
ncbi:MAG: hypothetical protein QW273_03350 [Candidatus Pacearchaeota archaeon]